MIKNLSQLKNVLKAGTKFIIVAHCREEYVGDTRKVTLANTQGFYSINTKRVDKTTTANNGKGSVLWWSNAPFWSFENGRAASTTAISSAMRSISLCPFVFLTSRRRN